MQCYQLPFRKQGPGVFRPPDPGAIVHVTREHSSRIRNWLPLQECGPPKVRQEINSQEHLSHGRASKLKLWTQNSLTHANVSGLYLSLNETNVMSLIPFLLAWTSYHEDLTHHGLHTSQKSKPWWEAQRDLCSVLCNHSEVSVKWQENQCLFCHLMVDRAQLKTCLHVENLGGGGSMSSDGGGGKAVNIATLLTPVITGNPSPSCHVHRALQVYLVTCPAGLKLGSAASTGVWTLSTWSVCESQYPLHMAPQQHFTPQQLMGHASAIISE